MFEILKIRTLNLINFVQYDVEYDGILNYTMKRSNNM